MIARIGTNRCLRCDSEVALIERPRLVTREDVGCAYHDISGSLVANARCQRCGDRFLAWVSLPDDTTPDALSPPLAARELAQEIAELAQEIAGYEAFRETMHRVLENMLISSEVPRFDYSDERYFNTK